MTFQKAKRVVTALLAMSAASCIMGLIMQAASVNGSDYAGLLALILLFLTIAVAFKWARCPWCGQLIIRRMFTVKDCPACRRNLETGKKKKGKGGR